VNAANLASSDRVHSLFGVHFVFDLTTLVDCTHFCYPPLFGRVTSLSILHVPFLYCCRVRDAL